MSILTSTHNHTTIAYLLCSTFWHDTKLFTFLKIIGSFHGLGMLLDSIGARRTTRYIKILKNKNKNKWFLSSGPSDLGDRQLELKAWDGKGYVCSLEIFIFPNPITPPHASYSYYHLLDAVRNKLNIHLNFDATILKSNEQGEMTASYKWTGRENNQLKSKDLRKLSIIPKEFLVYTSNQ